MKRLNYFLFALLALGVLSCQPEDPQLGPAPTDADAQFNAVPTAANANIIDFTAVSEGVNAVWDLGNGQSGTGTSVTGIYPNAGTYTVTLTIFGRGGSASSTQDIVIANTDPTLLDNPLFDILTGGATGPGSKTWVMDSAMAAHFGVGPDPVGAAGDFPEWYAAAPGDKGGVGLYDDRYTFYLANFQFDMVTQGQAYVHNGLAADFPGSFENSTDYTAPYPDQLGETWTIIEGADTILRVSGDSWLGMYTGVRDYRVVSISDTSIFLQYKHFDGGLHWYIRLIPEGFVPSGGNDPDPTFSLPFDFESADPPIFNGFGNSTAAVIANPDPSGINTSGNVLETVHGDQSWSGIEILLDAPLDFSGTPNINFKIWAPITGPVRVKVENSADPGEFVEIDADVLTTNAWEQISVDFSGSTNGVFDKFVLFPGWNVPNAGTFYIDDVEQQ